MDAGEVELSAAQATALVNDEVTLPQFRSLVVLSTAGPQTVSALADRLAVHATTMTRMCNRLVTRGLVHASRFTWRGTGATILAALEERA